MLNKIVLMGRLTRDPELRRTPNNKVVTSFSIAVDRDGEGVDFIDCVAWERTGEFVSDHFSKGSLICVVGRLQIRTWKDKEQNSRKAAEVVVERAYFAGDKPKTNGYPAPPRIPMDDDDSLIPF